MLSERMRTRIADPLLVITWLPSPWRLHVFIITLGRNKEWTQIGTWLNRWDNGPTRKNVGPSYVWLCACFPSGNPTRYDDWFKVWNFLDPFHLCIEVVVREKVKHQVNRRRRNTRLEKKKSWTTPSLIDSTPSWRTTRTLPILKRGKT